MQPQISIASSAMLVDLNIHSYTANVTDRAISDEIEAHKGAKTRAGKYTKNLFAGTTELSDINKFDAKIRLWHQSQTLPWSDRGVRLLPSSRFFEYKNMLNHFERVREEMVDNFLVRYDDLIAAAENVLDQMFDRSQYPEKSTIAGAFIFRYSFLPVPTVGDFRVDIGNEAMEELRKQFDSNIEDRIREGVEDIYARLRNSLVHMSEKLQDTNEVDKDGKPKKKRYHDSLITNARELCVTLQSLNLTNDQKLEQARQRFSQVISDIDTEDLKESPIVRSRVKSEVDDILSAFNF